VTCLGSGLPRQASIDQRESADRIDPALAAEATENTDATEPTEPIDKIEPAEPIDKMDPAEPIDKIDPLEPMLKMDPSLFRMGSFSQGRRSRQAMTVIPTGAWSPRRTVG
jgi:hypothetical protein